MNRRMLNDLIILETESFENANLEILDLAKRVVAGVEFVCIPEGSGQARLVNLLAWQPEAGIEVLDGDMIHADQVVHVAIHHAAGEQIGTSNAYALLAGEALASASDVYLLSRLANSGEETHFLADTLESFGMYCEMYAPNGEADLERLLTDITNDGFSAMAMLATFLFETSANLLQANALAETTQAVSHAAKHLYYPLIHHYNVTNWVLSTKRLSAGLEERAEAESFLKNTLKSEENFLNLLRSGCV